MFSVCLIVHNTNSVHTLSLHLQFSTCFMKKIDKHSSLNHLDIGTESKEQCICLTHQGASIKFINKIYTSSIKSPSLNGPFYVQEEWNSIAMGVVGNTYAALKHKLLKDCLSLSWPWCFFFLFFTFFLHKTEKLKARFISVFGICLPNSIEVDTINASWICIYVNMLYDKKIFS